MKFLSQKMSDLSYLKSNTLVYTILVIIFGFLVGQLTIKLGIVSLAVIVITFCFFLFFVSARISFLLLLFTRPLVDMFWNNSVFGLKNPLYILGGLVFFFLILYILLKKLAILEIPCSELVLFFLLAQLAAFGFGILNNFDSWFSVSATFVKIINGFLFFLVMPFVFRTKKQIDLLTTVLLLSVLIPMLISYYVWFTGSSGIFGGYFMGGEEIGRGIFLHERHGLTRLSGLYQGTFNIAFYGLLVLFLGLFKLQHLKNTPWKILLLVYILVSLALLYQTYSRVSWIMAFVGIGIWLLLKNKKIYLTIFVSGVIGFFLLSTQVQLRFSDEIGFFRGNTSFDSLGTGRGTQFIKYITIYFKHFSPVEKIFGMMGVVGRPENQLLHVLVISGLFGLVSYVAMMVGIAYRLFINFKKQLEPFYRELLLIAFVIHVAFIFAGISGTPLLWIHPQWITWTIVGLALYQARLVSSDRFNVQKPSGDLQQ